MTERRKKRRVVSPRDIVVNYSDNMVVATLRDISVNGAFIEAPMTDLPYTNSNVELGLTVTSNGKVKHCRIPGRISRVTDKGAAVVFGRTEVRASLDIANIVRQV